MPLAAKITVKKTLVPTSDSGRFDLLVGSTVVASAAANGGSGTTTVGPGTFTVKETASSGNLANYVTSIACTKNGLADVSGTGTSIAVTVAGDDVEVCTITNKRKATITLRKSLSPTSDTGKFNLIAGTKTLASGVGNGGSGSSSFAPDLVHVEGDRGERDDALQLHELDRLHEERRLRAVRERNEPDGVGLAR